MSLVAIGIRRWLANLPLICMLVVTVWFPTNLVLNYLVVYSGGRLDDFWSARMGMWVEWLFGPIYVAAMIHALAEHARGRSVGYLAALGCGLRLWGPLFLARLVAQLLVMLGLIYFLVPGIIMAVRFSLLDAALVVERRGIHEARKRSWDLSADRFWLILGVRLVAAIALTTFSSVIYLSYHLVVSQWQVDVTIQIFLETLIDCLSDILATLVTAVLFEMYWEASGAACERPASELERDAEIARPVPQSRPGEDDNPYASPR